MEKLYIGEQRVLKLETTINLVNYHLSKERNFAWGRDSIEVAGSILKRSGKSDGRNLEFIPKIFFFRRLLFLLVLSNRLKGNEVNSLEFRNYSNVAGFVTPNGVCITCHGD